MCETAWWADFPFYQEAEPGWAQSGTAERSDEGVVASDDEEPPTRREDEEFLKDSTLVGLAVSLWRLQSRIERLDPETHARERKMFTDSARQIGSVIEQFDVEFEDPTGQMYMTGRLDVEVVAWEDPEGEVSPHGSGSWIKKAMRPIVRRGERRLAVGQVVVVDAEDD